MRRGALPALLSGLITVSLIASACSAIGLGDTGEDVEPTPVTCDFVDPTPFEEHLGEEDVFTIHLDYRVELEDDDSWGCDVRIRDEAHRDSATVNVALFDERDDVSQMTHNGLVSIGSGVDGAITRGWKVEPRDFSPLRSTGYLHIPCSEGAIGADGVFVEQGVEDAFRATGPDEAVPGYEQIATVYVLAANAVSEELGCEGGPFPLPDGLDNEPPPHTPVSSVDQPCGTFPHHEVMQLLSEHQDATPAAPGDWNEWQSPGADFPLSSCQIWRPPVDAEQAGTYTFGPMLTFSRVAGQAAETYDLDWFDERYEPTGWEPDLPGEQRGMELSDNHYYALQRDCGEDTVVDVGHLHPDTGIPAADYEPLLEEWIRAQAKRDGCPIGQG